MKDGRIVLIGNCGRVGEVDCKGEILAITYDPSIDTLNTTEWRRTFSVNSTITEIDNSSILLDDGRILVIGGDNTMIYTP